MEVIQRADERIEKAIKYVNAVRLATPRGPLATSDRRFAGATTESGPLAAATDTPPAGYVDAGSLVSFVAGVSPRHRSDVLNSTLFAQLAASGAFDRESETEKWYGEYHTVLENIGWVIQAFDFSKYDTQEADFTADKVIAEVLAAIATEDDMAVITQTIAALKALKGDDGRVTLWDSNSSSLKKGNFQIGAASEKKGSVALKLGAFYFETDTTVNNVLFFRFSSSNTSLYKASEKLVLNEELYSEVRQEIKKKLGEKATQFVDSLPLGK